MRTIYLLLFLLASLIDFGQCPFGATISSPTVCLGTTLTANTVQQLSKIVWYNGSTADSTALATQTTIYTGTTVAGGNGIGSAPNQTSSPADIFIDNNGNIYVSDYGNNRIQKWAPGASEGVTVAGGNGTGFQSNQLYSPGNIFVDAIGTIYIADEGNDRVQKWPPGATTGITVAGGNGYGSAANQLAIPVGVFVDAAGNIYISETGNNRVQKWPPGAASGTTVAGGNGKGAAPNQLDAPSGLWVDRGGNLYIADDNNNRIQKWPPGATTGITVAGGNGRGAAPNQLASPTGIYLDNNGNLYIADNANDRIQLWTPGAASGTTVAGGNGRGANGDQFSASTAVYLDNNGNIFIADLDNHRIQEWGKQQIISIGKTYTPTTPGTYTAVITDNNGCSATSNSITIDPSVTPNLTITGPDTSVCSGKPATYTASTDYTGSAPSWAWAINRSPAGDNSPYFTSSQLSQGDTIYCQVSFNTACVSTVISAIPSAIRLTPAVQGQTYTISYGQHLTLTPSIQGEIAAWSWSPAAGLSDTTTANPTASPTASTDYTLAVTADDGCTAHGFIIVKVNFPIGIPSAFTPNGDGKNDIFYIKGGSGGIMIHSFAVFNRWGARVFQVENVPTDDPAFGWDGRISGQPAPPGAYVYMITLSLPGGHEEPLQGTIILIR